MTVDIKKYVSGFPAVDAPADTVALRWNVKDGKPTLYTKDELGIVREYVIIDTAWQVPPLDTNMPSSKLVKDALDTNSTEILSKISLSEKDTANGVATLDENGKIPISQINSVESITAILDTSISVTNEAILAFEDIFTLHANGLSVDTNGSIVCAVDGFYNLCFEAYVVESGDPFLSVWGEIKPFLTGIWELLPYSMSYDKIKDTGSNSVGFSGNLNLAVGDELRVKAMATSGTATFMTKTVIVDLGTVARYAAKLQLFRIGRIL